MNRLRQLLGMPIGTIRTHLHRGRKKLRERLQDAERREKGERHVR